MNLGVDQKPPIPCAVQVKYIFCTAHATANISSCLSIRPVASGTIPITTIAETRSPLRSSLSNLDAENASPEATLYQWESFGPMARIPSPTYAVNLHGWVMPCVGAQVALVSANSTISRCTFLPENFSGDKLLRSRIKSVTSDKLWRMD